MHLHELLLTFLKHLKRILQVSNFLRLYDMISCPPENNLKWKRRKSHHALQRYTMIEVSDQCKEPMSSFWITLSPSPIPALPPTLAVLLNRTDAPTRSWYTVNYLQHLVITILIWSQQLLAGVRWQSHWPLHDISCFCPASSVGGMSPAYAQATALLWWRLQK